jgi:hypothetical protein
MADLDELSMMIGEIRANTEFAKRWFSEHEHADQRRFDALAKRIDAIHGHGARIEMIEAQLVETKPVIEGVRRAKWAFVGFVGAMSIAGGVVGGKVSSAFQSMFKLLG